MGVAACYRGNALISRQMQRDRRDPIFDMMDDLNALPKHQDAIMPLGVVHISNEKPGWVVKVKGVKLKTYSTLREALRMVRVRVVGYENGGWVAVPFGGHV